jgi:hypothetical protein
MVDFRSLNTKTSRKFDGDQKADKRLKTVTQGLRR